MTPTRSVLIVDDDPFIRKLIATTLEDVASFEMREAADGIEAVKSATEQPPTIIFLDVHMPRLDGIGALRELRAIPGPDRATIVMLTAAGSEREREAREAGADLFLTKPFSPLDLLRIVDEIGSTTG
jgi:two-component system chemotaxis response regulator CheY